MTLAAWTRLPDPEPARELLLELSEAADLEHAEHLSRLTDLVLGALEGSVARFTVQVVGPSARS